jgi:hypothetical protein
VLYFEFGKGSGNNERISWSEFSKAKMGGFPIERPHRAAQIYEHGPGVVGCVRDGCVYKKDVKSDHEKSNVARKLKPADFARIEFGKK